MPINAGYEYFDAEKEYLNAKTTDDGAGHGSKRSLTLSLTSGTRGFTVQYSWWSITTSRNMTGDITILDKDGKLIQGTITSTMMPLKFSMETSFGGKEFKLTYSHPRDEGWKDKDKIKGSVLTSN